MPSKATARYIRISPYKVRRVLALIRGCDLEPALAALKFTPSAAAPLVHKVVSSAAANAEANHGLRRERLFVQQAYADEGPRLRRFQAGSMGRGGIIRHRMTHITVVLEEREAEGASPARRRRGAAPAARK